MVVIESEYICQKFRYQPNAIAPWLASLLMEAKCEIRKDIVVPMYTL